MKEQLLTLEELQGIDLQMDVLRDEEGRLLSQLDEIESELQQRREVLDSLREKLILLERDKQELENNHSAELENIKRSEANMKEIKTNKEYQAVGREIAAARKQAAELEEQVLQKIGQLDDLNSEISACSSDLEELEKNTALRKAEKNAELGKLTEDSESDRKRRDTLVKKLPSSIVRRYSMLREQRKGIALVEARDGSCLGCNLHLPPQLYNSLFKGEEIHTCPHCQRILILKPQVQQQQ